nr:hypothetical protein [Tanacetum cinerariifolium]
MAPKRIIRSKQVPPVTPAPTATTTIVTEAQLQALIDQGVATAMAKAEASRVRNGYGSNGSGPRLAQAVRECTYLYFLKCQPLNFKGIEGVIELTQWFEKMESVFNISNCTAACQVKYAACTLQGVAFTWWNSHVKTVTLEVAQALPWKTLKKMMTNKVEKYIGGVPDTIHDSVKATKPKTMHEAIEFATELIDKRIRDAVENKQKFKVDDVLPAEEQPLPTAVSPTAESPGYITKSEPEMEPEEEDGDVEKSEGDSIEYPTSGGDDDGEDLSEDDADYEDEEESSDSEEEEEEHLAPTVPAPALYSSVSASEETEPFKEGETAATPPPFGYRVAARISVQPHILMPFRSESEVERLLAIPTPPLSLVSPTSYPLPPFLLPLPIFTPLPTSSFPLPSSLPSTSGSESIPEADIPLRKRDRFTTPTGGYEVGGSSVAAAARQFRPALTITDRHRADDRLIGRLRRERGYFPPCLPLMHMRLLTPEIIVLRSWTTASHERSRSYMVELPCEDCYSGSCSGIAMENFKENDDRQELALMCDRTFPEESNRVEKCIGGVPDTIHDSVKATKPKTMQEAIEFATELMDKRIRDAVENKRKFEGTSRNNQNQPQQNKKQNTGRAYAAGNSDRNMYTGPKPLCSKCDYHHEGPCPPRCNNCKRVGHLTRDCKSRPTRQ